MRLNSPARRAAFGGVLTALIVVCLIAAAYLPAGRLGFYFIAAFLPVTAIAEGRRGLAALCATAACALALLILPDKLAILPYACILAYYAVLRDLFSATGRILGKLLQLLCFNAGLLLWGILLVNLFGLSPAEFFPIEMTTLLWVLFAVAAQIAFLLLDYLFGLVCEYYVERLKPRLFHK